MHYLITGGAGYIGSVLALYAANSGHRVTILDNLSYDQGHIVSVLASHDNIKFSRRDVRDVNLHDVIKHADAVVHLAAVVGAPACDERQKDATETNAIAVNTLVRQMSSNQVLIYPNTNSGYGSTGNQTCTEDTPLVPLSLYARTKAAGEHSALSHKRAVVLRLATVFGWSPRMRLDLIVNQFAFQAYFNRKISVYGGSMRRNFVHVRDVARLIVSLSVTTSAYGNVYNVGNDELNMTKLDLASTVARFYGATVEEADGDDPDKRDYLVSNAKLNNLGLGCAYNLSDGLGELGSWMASLPYDEAARARTTAGMYNIAR